MIKIPGLIKILLSVCIVILIGIAITAIRLFDITGEKGSGLSQDYVYNIDDSMRIDSNLILYAESSEAIDTGFEISHGIAVDSQGIIYAAGDKSVRLFNESGDLHGEIELDDNPSCITVNKTGDIYIGMGNHVEVYGSDKQYLASLAALDANAVITSIAVLGNDVFVADAGNRIVLRYDAEGKLINRIGDKDKERNIAGFVVPSPYFDLAIASDGLLRVVNPGRCRIEAYTFDGDLELWWGTRSFHIDGFCGCCNPVNFAILEDGSFVTAEKGLIRIKVYDSEGNFSCVVAGPEQLIPPDEADMYEYPPNGRGDGFDLAVDNKQQILILDTIKNVIRTFTKIK